MSVVWKFISQTHGRGRLSLVDWITYLYLLFGFLLIFLPVCWIGLNSLKPAFQLDREDLSLLPAEYTQLARATVYGPDGRSIFIISDLPDWVLNWQDLKDNQKVEYDLDEFLSGYEGDTLYALRSHLGQVPVQARQMIAELNLPDWLLRYPALAAQAKSAYDIESILNRLPKQEQRLLAEFILAEPYRPSKLVRQVLVIAPDPETGAATKFAVPRYDPTKKMLPARYADNRNGQVVKIETAKAKTERVLRPALENYLEPLTGQAYGVDLNFARCFTNSVLVTVIATLITLLINSMAAFGLSKYRFRGQVFFFIFILATLMVPNTITLVGVFKAINTTGLSGSIWGVIIPGAATPAGVFLLRQYMLTIPDELIEAARMDAASEWKIYWRIMLPLAMPAIAALGILSVIWRWNDLILPMVAIATTKDAYTIQLCLLEFRGEFINQEHYRLAMTVVSLIPTTLVFAFLQKYITTGIANTGMK